MSPLDDHDSRAMPPPPVPILDPELTALTSCLKNAVIKTGQIYSFYADRARLNHAYKPHDSLTASLGREIEKYDQLCDAIESHLLRAIAVLQRDLRREEQRKKDSALAASKSKASDPLRAAEAVAVHESIPLEESVLETPTLTSSPATAPPGRRPSAISISSLQRPAVPLKLDLSSASLRIAEDPALFSDGLASPVTLAPKSARPLAPNEFPPELMAAFASAATSSNRGAVDIDLTEDDEAHLPMSIDPAAGSSADKPIELDLDAMEIDMSDLFGDSSEHEESTNSKTAMEGLFSTHKVHSAGNAMQSDGKSQKEEGSFLTTFTGDTGNIMFARATPKPPSTGQHAPSPNTVLASLQSSGDNGPPSNLSTTMGSGGTFDISSLDLSHLSPGFFSNTGDTDVHFSMDDFLSMGGNTGEGKDIGTSNVP